MKKITRLGDFEITKDTCFVCGRPAETAEHLFPKWLQRKFNLWDERLVIPNQTSIAYRNLTVPCCAKCNNESFSGLEKKIASGTESDGDIWRWANKVHFALTVKDKFLEWDRKNPGYKIGDVISPSDPLEQSRHFLHCVSGDFTAKPDPFGSVFKFTFTSPQEFNFVHMISSQTVCISFGNRGYVVYVRDGQVMKNNFSKELTELHKKEKLEMVDMLFFYAKSVEYIERFKLSMPILVTPGSIVKLGRAVVREERPVNKELLAALCKWMGFTWVDSETL